MSERGGIQPGGTLRWTWERTRPSGCRYPRRENREVNRVGNGDARTTEHSVTELEDERDLQRSPPPEFFQLRAPQSGARADGEAPALLLLCHTFKVHVATTYASGSS